MVSLRFHQRLGRKADVERDARTHEPVVVAGAGFGTDTNVVTFITKDSTQQLEIMSKENVAMKLLDRLLEM